MGLKPHALYSALAASRRGSVSSTMNLPSNWCEQTGTIFTARASELPRQSGSVRRTGQGVAGGMPTCEQVLEKQHLFSSNLSQRTWNRHRLKEENIPKGADQAHST
jgi:hypothetical protein